MRPKLFLRTKEICFAVILVSLPISSLAADRIVLDRIVARVNGKAVTESQVQEVIQNAPWGPGITMTEKYEQALGQLIEENLVVHAAEQAGNMAVDDVKIRAQAKRQLEIARIRAGSEEVFDQELAKEGLTQDELQEIYEVRLRQQAMVTQMMSRQESRFRTRTVVQADEIMESFEAQKELFQEGNLRWIAFLVPSGTRGPAKDQIETRARKALDLVRRGRNYAETAQRTQGDLGASPEGEALKVFRGDISPNLGDIAFEVPKSKWGSARFVESKDGFFVYEVVEIKEPKFEEHRDRVRNYLVRKKVAKKMKDWLSALGQEAVIEQPAGSLIEDDSGD